MADGAVPGDALLQKIGADHGKTAAQVGLRWLIQQGVVALSKTAKPARVAQNFDIFNFALTQAEMAAIGALAHRMGGWSIRSVLRPLGSNRGTIMKRRLNWPLLALAIGAFGIGTTAFPPMGLLLVIADGVGVSIPSVGLLVSAMPSGSPLARRS